MTYRINRPGSVQQIPPHKCSRLMSSAVFLTNMPSLERERVGCEMEQSEHFALSFSMPRRRINKGKPSKMKTIILVRIFNTGMVQSCSRYTSCTCWFQLCSQVTSWFRAIHSASNDRVEGNHCTHDTPIFRPLDHETLSFEKMDERKAFMKLQCPLMVKTNRASYVLKTPGYVRSEVAVTFWLFSLRSSSLRPFSLRPSSRLSSWLSS